MITLHYSPTDASLAPHLLLEELGVEYTLALVDRSVNAQKSSDYLRMNPNGLIPVLVDGAVTIYETAALLLHLADTRAQGRLAPKLASAERAHYYKWMVWTSATLHAALIPYFYAERCVAPGNAQGAREVKELAQQRVAALLEQIEAQLQSHQAAWLLGDSFCAIDPYLLMLGGWTRRFERPAASFAHLGSYLRRVAERPASQAVFRHEGIDAAVWLSARSLA